MDPAFADAVRALLSTLAAGGAPVVARGGAFERVLHEASPGDPRAAVAALAERWFQAAASAEARTDEPILNRPDISEPEKLHAILHQHVVRLRRWQELSSNESTFYRYRRAAYAQFAERLWADMARQPFPTNRPRPDYGRLIGRQADVAGLLRALDDAGGAVVGIEGPGGSGKTALLHGVAEAIEAAVRAWRPADADVAAPRFEGLVWIARAEGLDLPHLLDATARTLDYPGLLARPVEDRRQAVRDLLARRAVLLIVDDVDVTADSRGVLRFLVDLPGASRALVAARRRLPPDVRAFTPPPLAEAEVRELLVAEGERQGAPSTGRALAQGATFPGPLAAAGRYPLLAGWAVGQLRRGQTVERVRQRLTRAEGEVFEAMFSASVDGLSAGARSLLSVVTLLPGPVDRPTLVAAGGDGSEGALDELLETSLLEVSGAGYGDADRRYGLHPVTTSFVAARLPLAPEDEAAAAVRLAAHFASVAERLGGPTRNWRTFGRLEEALPNVMAVVDRATLPRGPAHEAFDQSLLGLAHGMRNVFLFGRAWAEGLTLFHRAREAAQRLGDLRAEGWNTYRLGLLHYELGTGGFVEAAQRAREAADLLGRAGDQRGLGHAWRLLGRALRERGQVDEAARLLADAEALLVAYGHGDDVAIVRASRADLLRQTGHPDEALDLYEAVLRNSLEDPGTEANVRHDLGQIALAQGFIAEARASFEAAEALAEAAGARAILARGRLGRARVARIAGDVAEARSLAVAAADLFERLGDAERAREARAIFEGVR